MGFFTSVVGQKWGILRGNYLRSIFDTVCNLQLKCSLPTVVFLVN